MLYFDFLPYRKSGRPKKVLEFLNTPNLDKTFECKRCKERQTTLEDFKDHFRIHSQSVAVGNTVQQLSHISLDAIPEIATVYIRCPDCNELTANYGLHQLKHFKQMCYVCGKVFRSFSGWRRHQKFEKAMETGERNHICDKCGKAFILVSALTEHRRLHSKERPHTCSICGKGFKQKAHMTRHLFIHSEVKPISCRYCGKGFTNNFNLKSHLRSHTGEKPYICTLCNKSFAHNGSLRAHMKSEHLINVGLACQSVQEFDDFALPMKKKPGRKKKSTPETVDKINKRLLPEVSSNNKTVLPEQNAHERTPKHEHDAQQEQVKNILQRHHKVQETFMQVAGDIEAHKSCTEPSTNEQQHEVLKALENDSYRKEEVSAILSIAAVSSGITIALQDDTSANESVDMKKHQQNSNVQPTSYQQTYTSFDHREQHDERRVEVTSNLPASSAECTVWQGASSQYAHQRTMDSSTIMNSPNVLVQSTPPVSTTQHHHVEVSRAITEPGIGVIETHVPQVSREEEVDVEGMMSRLVEPGLLVHGDHRNLNSQTQRVTNIQVPCESDAGQPFDSVEIAIPQMTEQRNQNQYVQ